MKKLLLLRSEQAPGMEILNLCHRSKISTVSTGRHHHPPLHMAEFFASENAATSLWERINIDHQEKNTGDSPALEQIILEHRPDIVVVLSPFYISQELQVRESIQRFLPSSVLTPLSFKALIRILETLTHCADLGVRPSIVFNSSVAAFGPSGAGIHNYAANRESQSMPLTRIGMNAQYMEMLCNSHASIHDLDLRILRLPIVVGAKGKTPRLGTQTNFLTQILNLTSKRTPERVELLDFCPNSRIPMIHAEDAARAILALGSAPRRSLSKRCYSAQAFPAPKVGQIVERVRDRYPGIKIQFRTRSKKGPCCPQLPRLIDDSQARSDWKWRPKIQNIDTLLQESLIGEC